MYFRHVPGTTGEGAIVAQQLGSSNLRSGRQATKALLRTLQGPPVLHIASHSFFLTDATTPATIAEILRVVSESLHTQSGLYEMNLSVPATVRAGIALSGANGDAAKGTRGRAHDGVLTALEFAGLDLRDTQLAVLSACETGVGDPTFGEGIDGMRTALRIAGARTRLLSLWRVSDCATMQFMANWYRRMVAGEDRIEALRSAKLDMLRGQVMSTSACLAHAVSLTASEKQKANWSDPYFWAPFIAEGANGRL